MQWTFTRVVYQCLEGMLSISGAVPGALDYIAVLSTSRILSLPTSNLLCKYINPKVRWYLHIGKSNQQKSPYEFNNPAQTVFFSCVYDETWRPILNVHLSYKPPSSWRVLFWSGGLPGQFSRLKKLRTLVVPDGGCRKGVIIQWR